MEVELFVNRDAEEAPGKAEHSTGNNNYDSNLSPPGNDFDLVA